MESASKPHYFHFYRLVVVVLLPLILSLIVAISVPGNSCFRIDKELTNFADSDGGNDRVKVKPVRTGQVQTDNENLEAIDEDDGHRFWNVEIGSVENFGFSFMCGGTLINSRTVISSASCLKETVSIPTQVQTGNHEIYQIESIILHPNFTEGSFYNDIALVKLVQPFLQRHGIVLPIVRSSHFNDDFIDATSDDGTGTGSTVTLITDWDFALREPALLKPTSLAISRIIPESENNFAFVSTINGASIISNNEDCEKVYRDYCVENSIEFDAIFPRGIDSTLICTLLNNGADCKDDRGYQLIETTSATASKVRHVLLGTRAMGSSMESSQCDFINLPGIFTNVTAFSSWISITSNSIH